MIRAILLIPYFVLATIFWGSSTILGALFRVKDRPGSIYDIAPRQWARGILKLAGVRIVEHDVQHKEAAQHIFVANHLGNFDVLALAASLKWMKFVAKAELFRIPIFGRAMLAAGMVPIERANRKKAFASYDVATQRIQAGASVAVYPEGTRGHAYPLRPFKKGPFVLAIQAQAPIVPVYIYGALDVMRKGQLRVNPGEIHMHFLPPIPTTGMTYEDRDKLAEMTYTAMAKCLQEKYGIESPPYRNA